MLTEAEVSTLANEIGLQMGLFQQHELSGLGFAATSPEDSRLWQKCKSMPGASFQFSSACHYEHWK
jgi:hypothetical protein